MEKLLNRRRTRRGAPPMGDPKGTRQELEEEISALRQALSLRQDGMEAGIMESNMIASSMDAILLMDDTQNLVQFNAAAERVFGYPASQVLGKSIQNLLPEQFRERHLQSIQNFARTGLSSRNTQALGTVSGLRANGEIFPLEISIGRITRDGRILYFAIARDVSERTELEELLVRQYDSLNSLHQITLGLLGQRELKELLQLIVDEAAKLLDSTYCEMLLPENSELVAKAFTQGSPLPSGNRFKRDDAPLSWKVFDSGVPAILGDYSDWGPHNPIFESHHFHAAVSIPILVREKCIGVLGFARVQPGYFFTEEDILSASRFAAIAALAMENSRLYREIQMLATTDELTGLRNRRSLMEIGDREIIRSLRYGRPLSLLMLDADHFKQINDTWGHAAGDRVLREVARQCLDQIRTTDTVGRYSLADESEIIIGRLGGEEFVILLPETELKQALIVAERIRAWIEKMIVPVRLNGHEEAGTIRVTVSIGVSTLKPENDSLHDVLTRADHALYTAKETGRNRICSQAP